MKHRFPSLSKPAATLLASIITCGFLLQPAAADAPIVQMQTSQGTVTLTLYADQAPITVANFLNYTRSGFYDDTLFHRVVPGFVIQGGGFTPDFELKPTGRPIRNEADNGLRNLAGTIAMARTYDPHSATAQFFINLDDNDFLNFTAETESGWGYAVFGRVIDGKEVIDRIAALPTTSLANGLRDVPEENVVIDSARVITESSEARYDPQTLILELPVVQVGERIYAAQMRYLGNGHFELTRLTALHASFSFPDAQYDPTTATLRLEAVDAGTAVYTARLAYIGGGRLRLTQLEKGIIQK